MSMTTLGEVRKRIDDLAQLYIDQLINVDDISFKGLDEVNIGDESFYLRPVAQQLIASRLGIPVQYLRKCQSEVQAYNLNHWLGQERNEKLFIRFDDMDIRAIFTPRYRPVDNFEIVETLCSLGYGYDRKVQCHLDGEFMLLSIPDNEKEFSVKGDTMCPGISISNSEVGLASLSLSIFILRLVCTNGLISQTDVTSSYRHVSSKILKEFPDIMANITNGLDLQRRQIKMSIESWVNEPMSTISSFNKQFQLGKPECEAVDWAWPMEQGHAMFNIVNTYTRAAQHGNLSAESSYKLQKVGGTILGMLN